MNKKLYTVPRIYFMRDFKSGRRVVRHSYIRGQRTTKGQRRIMQLVQSGRWSLSPANAWTDWLPMPGILN